MPTTSQRVRQSIANMPAKRLFRRHEEARLFFNHATDMVGKPAIRVGNIRPAFHHEDFRLFIQPAQTRRTRRAARYSPDDDYLHDRVSLLPVGVLFQWSRPSNLPEAAKVVFQKVEMPAPPINGLPAASS